MEEQNDGNIEENKETVQLSLKPRSIENELTDSYLDYAMSVIVGRALPDVRDGFKPVHRRVLFSMHEVSNTHDKPYKKSARIVGEVLGKYHPHGDSAIYDSLVRMAQDFSLRYPLVDGQGNFGSIDGDNAAAMRYTEVRMKKLSSMMLADIEKDTVDFTPNFDGTLKEPTVLPSRLPNLLINGSSGIAVGMATNIPPHNLVEVCDAVEAIINDHEIDDSSLCQLVRGPDFPTGGMILGRSGITQAYKTGRGSIKIRSVAEIVDSKKDKNKQSIKVTQIPYMVNKSNLVRQIAELARDKKIEGIADIQDFSDKKGIEVVIELKKGANADVVLNHLYSKTQLQTSFGIINLALVDGQPKVLPLKDMLLEFIKHRKVVITRRSRFDLGVAKDRKHILEGLKKALEDIDNIITTIKKATDTTTARSQLMGNWDFSEKQANAILDMKLSRLTNLERNKIDDEDKKLAELIAELESILADEKKVEQLIKDELIHIKENYGDERKTQITDVDDSDIDDLDLIPKEPVAVIITENDYIKRISLSEYRSQKRGGKGVIGTETKEEDRIKDLLISTTHDMLLFFTDGGMVHWLPVYKIPSASRYSKGKAIINLLDLKNERISSCISVSEFTDNQFLIMATKKGIVKRTSLTAYSRPRRGGIRAITLKDGDDLIEVRKTDGNTDILLATTKGQSIRFSEEQVREIGRTGQGVRGIDLKDNDYVVDMALCKNPTILTVCENGFGKRTPIEDYRQQNRAGSGIINIKTSQRNGNVVGVRSVDDGDEILMLSSSNKAIRMPVKDISIVGRNTQGVRLMRLSDGEKIVAIEHLKPESDGDENGKLDSGGSPPPVDDRQSEATEIDAGAKEKKVTEIQEDDGSTHSLADGVEKEDQGVKKSDPDTKEVTEIQEDDGSTHSPDKTVSDPNTPVSKKISTGLVDMPEAKVNGNKKSESQEKGFLGGLVDRIKRKEE